MKASETSLRQLLEGTKQFQIPLFQRRYSWKEKNWQTLWDDLMSIYEEDIEDDDNYFMGTIVTQSIGGTADGISPFIVIDGQQRLTTLTLLLAVIRNILKESNRKEEADEIEEQYLINKFKKEEDRYKILPSQADKNIYISIVEGKEIKDVGDTSLIHKSFAFFSRKIKGNKSYNIDLDKFKSIVLNKLQVVNITSDENDNPYLIFESLNNKGLDLTQSDLIRNYIFMQFPKSERDEIYQKKWLPIEEKFKSNGDDLKELTQFFWFYLRKDGTAVREKEIYKQMKCLFDRIDSDEDRKQQLEEVLLFSGYYEKMRFPEREDNESLQRQFSRLLRLDFKTCHVFLFSIYDLYSNGELSDTSFYKILAILESYFIRRFFTDRSTRVLGKVFDSLYKKIYSRDDGDIEHKLIKVLREMSGNEIFPSDEEFKEGLINKAIYKSNDIDRVKLILETLEDDLKPQTKEKIKIDNTNLTIEHIMPQTLGMEWTKCLGTDAEEIHSKYLNTLCNLTLTADNSELSNSIFSKKKQIYDKSKMHLNDYFKSIDRWNEEEMNKRAEYLATKALKIWEMP
jgi:uncharacterized protein with ParB-like and HNH nuclease domain